MSAGVQDLVAVVTGGASGIGAAIVRRLADGGARVAALDLQQGDGPALNLHADVRDGRSIDDAVRAVAAEFGGIDILVNNAGVGAQGTVESNPDEEWHRLWDINVVGIARLSRAALPHLRHSSAASIVNLASIAATAGLPERALYTATKGAVLALTRAMAADHLVDGIRVNSISPGTVDTPWIGRLLASAPDPGAERRALEARQPHGRLVRADEVAEAVAYLAGRDAGSTTGTNLAVDGGMQNLRLRR